MIKRSIEKNSVCSFRQQLGESEFGEEQLLVSKYIKKAVDLASEEFKNSLANAKRKKESTA